MEQGHIQIILNGTTISMPDPDLDLDSLEDDVILVARDLTPTVTVQLDRSRVIGIATDGGTRTSHSAILARSLGIPAVVGLGDISTTVGVGQVLALDGRSGRLVLSPSESEIRLYRERNQRARSWEQEISLPAQEEAVTPDPQPVVVRANIDLRAKRQPRARTAPRESGSSGRSFSWWAGACRPTRTKDWRVADGVLNNHTAGGNLVTRDSFRDFKLHIEFKYPRNGNSGVYLRGRHEVQIEDSPPSRVQTEALGAVYGFLPPSEAAATGPDQWQAYDITLIGRHVTVALNGITVISNQEIPGTTGGALSCDEGAPGPLMLQGDHGPIAFRNIVLTPAQ